MFTIRVGKKQSFTVNKLYFPVEFSQSQMLTLTLFKTMCRFLDVMLLQYTWVGTWSIKYYFDFCHWRVLNFFFMEICCRATEIWVLENHEFCPFQSPISQLPYNRSSWKNFLGLSYDRSRNGILWFMSETSPVLRKMTWLKPWKSKNGEKWHFHCPWSPKRLGFGPWPIKAQWISGLSLFTIPDLVDFHSEGAEILKVENHKRDALLQKLFIWP